MKNCKFERCKQCNYVKINGIFYDDNGKEVSSLKHLNSVCYKNKYSECINPEKIDNYTESFIIF